MHRETIHALARSRRQIIRCEEHLAEIQGRLRATSGVVAKAREIVQTYVAGGAEDDEQHLPKSDAAAVGLSLSQRD